MRRVLEVSVAIFYADRQQPEGERATIDDVHLPANVPAKRRERRKKGS
jgi:hypothetical protein